MSDVLSWPNLRPSRGAAFVIHLVLSVVIFSSLVAMMLVYWFPGDLFMMDGGWQGLKLVAMVDLVLGPALTLILFKPGKPGLKTDLSLIAAVQIVALAYGFYATYNQRVVAVVFAEHEFATVSAKDNREAEVTLLQMDASPKPLPAIEPFRVPLLMTAPAENFGQYIADILNGYPGAHHRSDQYLVLHGYQPDIQKYQQSEQQLKDAGAFTDVALAVKRLDREMDELEVYRFRARYAKGYALYDPEQSRILDVVKAPPKVEGKNIVAEQTE